MSLIVTRDLRVSFPRNGETPLEVLKGVDLSIDRGEIVTLVGESGCGKSTLIRALLGLQAATSGSVSYWGEDLAASTFRWTPEKRLRSALVHQDSYAAFNPHHSLGSILMAPLKRHRRGCDARGQALAALERVELRPAERFFSLYSHQLSGGQRQRAALARALLLGPELVVADEPVSGLDASVKVEILDLVRRINEDQGTAFLYVTHDLATAARLPRSRLIVLYLGEVVESGPLLELLRKPAHPYLQAMLSAIAPPDPRAARARPMLSEKLLRRATADVVDGCLFEARCPQAVAECRLRRPALRPSGSPPRRVACHLAPFQVEDR